MTTTAERVMRGLKQFQRDTVLHIAHQFYGEVAATADGRTGRFLVADETGLGKSVVARGVIAHAIDALRAERPDKPINVVYICSNQDLARQNIRRLNVSDDRLAEINTRLTMLATEGRALTRGRQTGAGELNLVSFTPGTSFSNGGMRQGKGNERALIALLLERLLQPSPDDWTRILRLLRGWIDNVGRFRDRHVANLRADLEEHGIDPQIEESFGRIADETGALGRFTALVSRIDLAQSQELPDDIWHAVQDSIAELRHALAKAGVETLRPDLIILDEFQRFRHLLDSTQDSEAAELAQHLFQRGDARVLLLSATPYKPFTRGDEEGDHYKDFLSVVRFLAGGAPGAELPVRNALEEYRRALTRDGDVASAAKAVRDRLLPFMTRAERPEVVEGESLVQERPLAVKSPTSDDLLGWVGLRKLADAVDSPLELDRWKSVPYFANYMDGYKLGQDVTERLEQDAASIEQLLAQTQSLPCDVQEPGASVDAGNAKLRAFIEATVGQGWWRAIWVPPSMPYLEPGANYAPLHEHGMTKQVVFSSWSAVPTSVAALVSREAMRMRVTRKGGAAADNESTLHGLEYKMAATGAPQSMSALTLFWPHPGIADLGDPVRAARRQGSRVSSDALLQAIRQSLPVEDAGEAWHAFFGAPGALPSELKNTKMALLTLGDGRPKWKSALQQHMTEAIAMARKSGAAAKSSHRWLPDLAAFSPGNSAYRALRTIAGPHVSNSELWGAAFVLAQGLRTLFNRGETVVLLNTLDEAAGLEDRPYWQKVLSYSADGNLQAVLDEYLFQLHKDRGGHELDGAALMTVAEQASEVLGLQRVNYRGRGVDAERTPIDIGARWALRYGDANVRSTSDSGEQRQANVRAAFNSPFAPFVLTSTSAGQEGIDFHWWSHAVVHWNLPSSPVDFEQREGRVNRFAGHAIRKNVAEQHWADVLSCDEVSPWEAAFGAAVEASRGKGDFAPWWMYPGSSRIHRVLTNFPLSIDESRYAQLKRDLVLYRLTLGQPRQEDMLELLAARGVTGHEVPSIDLSAPRNWLGSRAGEDVHEQP